MTQRLSVAAVLVAAALFASVSAAPAPEPSAFVGGIALGLFASTPDYDYAHLLDEMRSRGATDAMLVVQWYQGDSASPEVVRDASRTVTDERLRRTIRHARSLGMRVTVMPIVRLRSRNADQWRGTMSPPAEAWFASYGAKLDELAKLCAEESVERLVVGSELGSMAKHEQQWRALIAETRKAFDGRITYSANWDDFDHDWWDAVDEIGISAYFPLSDAPDPATPELKRAWRAPRARLAKLKQLGKPVLLTEVGYPAHQRAAEVPWDQHADPTPSPKLQARLYRAFCDAVVATDTVDGYFAWNWFGFGGPSDRTYSPRGKPAATEIERCLRAN